MRASRRVAVVSLVLLYALLVALAMAGAAVAVDRVLAQGLPSGVCDALKAERAKYPGDLRGLCADPASPGCPLGQVLNRVAWQFRADGWGLSRKDFGSYTSSPAGPVAVDILHHKPTNMLYDVFVAAGEETSVNCGPGHLPEGDPEYWKRRPWVAPVDPGGAAPEPPEPDPGPDPDPEPDPALGGRLEALERAHGALLGRVAALEQLAAKQAEAHAAAARLLEEMELRLRTVESKALAQPCDWADVSTGRTWGHAHMVRVCVPRGMQ